jgi:hypothetical protein
MTDAGNSDKPATADTERPTVIDLEAEEIRHEEPQQQSPPPKPARPSRWRSYALVLAGLAAAFAGAWLYRDYGASWWPGSQMQALESRIANLESSARTLGEQATVLGSGIEDLRKSLADAAASASGATTAAEDAKSGTVKLAARIDQAESAVASLRTAIDELNKSLAQGGNGTTAPAPDATRLAAIEARVAELEKTVAALKSGPTADAQSATLLSQSLADLKAKLAAGTPFKAELERIAALVPAAPGLDVLSNHAEAGIANASQLAEELGRIAAALPGPDQPVAADEKGYWDTFGDLLGSLVIIRRIGEVDWRAAATAAQDAAAAGDLKGAIDALEKTEGEKPAAVADWLNRARARLAAETAAEDVSAAVLRQIAALGGAQ